MEVSYPKGYKIILDNNIKTVILVAARDFGRCPLASRLNRACWPVLGTPVLQRLIEELAEQGLRRIAICCESQARQIRACMDLPEELDIEFHEDTFPRGPAGSIRDVINPQRDEQILVLPACIVAFPDIELMADAHRRSGAEVTVFGVPENSRTFPGRQSQIYMCRSSIFDQIPEKGYFDIKEGLIPALVRADKKIFAAQLPDPVIGYNNWREYLLASKYLLANGSVSNSGEHDFDFNSKEHAQIGRNVRRASTAKLIGPVVVGDNSIIADNVIIFGPAIIGNNVCIGPGSMIEESVLWDHSAIGSGSRIRSSLIDEGRAVAKHTLVSDQLQSVPKTLTQKCKNALCRRLITTQIKSQSAGRKAVPESVPLSQLFQKSGLGYTRPAIFVVAMLVLIFTYWSPTLKDLWDIWMQSDEYSSGLLVPFVAGYILWLRRETFLHTQIKPSVWGIILLIAIQGFRYWSMYHMFDSGERLSFVLSIGALSFAFFGLQFFKIFLSIYLFLFLMLPLPRRIESVIIDPLQTWATVSSVFCLETLGYNASRQGNIIDINGTLVAVAEACNGLRMMTAFIIVSYVTALLIRVKRWEKIIILISSIPIALLCNTIRLTLTSIAFTMLDTQRWERIFHDFGGFAMVPLALGFVVLELWLLSRIVIEPKNINE